MGTNLVKCHGEVEEPHVVLVGPPREVPITLDAQNLPPVRKLIALQTHTHTHQVEEQLIFKNVLLDDCCKLRFSKSPGAGHV